MPVIEVHETKIPLIAGLTSVILFSIALFCAVLSSAVKGDIPSAVICTLIFGAFILAGNYLIADYFRRKLLLYPDHLTYTPAVGKTRTISYQEIQVLKWQAERCVLYSREGKRLAAFETNMTDSLNAVCYLNSKGIFIDEKQNPRFKNADAKKQADIAYISSRWTKEQIMKEKKAVRIIGIALLLLTASSFLLSMKWRIFVYALTLLFSYSLYLYFYPKMIFKESKKCDEYHIAFPAWAVWLCFLFLIPISSNLNFRENMWLLLSLILTGLLSIPYFLIQMIRKKRESLLKMAGIIFLLFFFAFLSTPAINYAATFSSPSHETVFISEKEIHRNSHNTTSYYFHFTWQDKEQNMQVSKSLYNSLKEGDPVRICIRKSIFGMEYYILHK